MAYSTINKSTDHFNTKLYTGNYSTNAITGVGFQPDLTWIKTRTTAGENHYLFDAIRGVTKYIHSDTAAGQSTNSATLTTFGSDGFTVGANNSVNKSGEPLVSWNWKANGQGSSNTDGTINTTYTSANTTSGVSLVQFTGTGANATVGHGLGVAPSVIITRPTSQSGTWRVYNEALGNTQYLTLNTTAAQGTGSTMWNGSPTNQVFTLGSSSDTNGSGVTFIAYCFAEKKGFSKMGKYTGTGNSDGAFVYTGFKPAWVLIKNTTATEAWFLYDNKRGYNGAMKALFPDEEAAEGGAADNIDLLSNGFKLKTAGAILNSATTFSYIAFAAAPFVGTNNVPATAR